MGWALPTWWVIQLVCRVSLDTSTAWTPRRQLECLHYVDNRTISQSAAGLIERHSENSYSAPIPIHRLYYRCLFQEEKRKTKTRMADCHSSDPPPPPPSPPPRLLANDSQSFDREQESPDRAPFRKNSSNTSLNSVPSPTYSFVWITLSNSSYFDETSFRSVSLECEDRSEIGVSILCTLQSQEYQNVQEPRGKSKWTYLLAIVAIAGGGLGNILVCLAVCLDRSLQNVTNYFLLSLAVADLLVSLFVMPLGAIQGFFGYWPLGIAWCNVYVSCDVLACSCSIMHMCCISLGRYLGIRNPLKTRHTYSTKRLVGFKIAVVWALSLMVSGWVTFLGLHESKNIMPKPYQCVINNQTFSLFGSLVAFYIPMFIMVVTYTRTVQLLRKKARFLKQKPGSEHEGPTFRHLGGRFRNPLPNREVITIPLSPDAGSKPQAKRSFTSPHKWRTNVIFRSNIKSTTMDINASHPNLVGKVRRPNGTRLASIPNTHVKDENKETATGRNTRSRTLRLPLNVTSSNLNIRFLVNRNKRQNIAAVANVVLTEQKASKVLGLVFLAFVLCWAPFFLFNVFFTFCDRSHCNQVPDHFIDLALWLGYISSTINPIIYTIFNRTFRSAFNRLLHCNCHRLSRPPRYRSVHENRISALVAQTPSSAAAGAAAVPLSLSLQGTPLITPSSASSLLTNVHSPVIENQYMSTDFAESSTTTTT